jgi:hypothetical protein
MSAGRIIKGPGREIEPSVFRKYGTVLLESVRRDDENVYSYLFQDPAAVIQCSSSRMVESSIEQIEEITRKGMYAAGFMAYEAGFPYSGSVFTKRSSALKALCSSRLPTIPMNW